MQKIVLSSVLLLLGAGLLAQSPVIKAYAYSRSTVPGIRPPVVNETDAGKQQADNPFPPNYFLYLEAAKRSPLSLSGVFIHGLFYRGSLQRVGTPVKVPKAAAAATTGKKEDILVPKTANDVYGIRDLTATKSMPVLSDAEKNLVRDNELVFLLWLDKKKTFTAVKKIIALAPVMGM